MSNQRMENLMYEQLASYPELVHDLFHKKKDALILFKNNEKAPFYSTENIRPFLNTGKGSKSEYTISIFLENTEASVLNYKNIDKLYKNSGESGYYIQFEIKNKIIKQCIFSLKRYGNKEHTLYALYINRFFDNDLIDNSKNEIYRSLFDYADELIAISNVHGQFIELNRIWTTVTGHSEESLKSVNFFRFIHPDDLEKSFKIFRKLYKGESNSITTELRFRNKDGSYIWLEFNAVASPNMQIFYAVARDVSKHKTLIEFKKRANRILIDLSTNCTLENTSYDDFIDHLFKECHSLLDISSISIWNYNPKSKDLICTKELSENLTQNEKMINQTFNEKDYPTYFKAINKGKSLVIDNIFKDKRVYEFQTNYYHSFNIKSTVDSLIYDEKGLLGLLNVHKCDVACEWKDEELEFIFSVTEIISRSISNNKLKDSARQVKKLNEQLQLAINASNLGIWELYNTGNFTTNDQFNEIFELSTNSKIVQLEEIKELVFKEDLEILKKLFAKKKDKLEISNLRFRIKTKSGQIKYLLGFSQCHFNEKKTFEKWIGIIIDITELTESQKLLNEKENKLQNTIKTIDDVIYVLDKDGYFQENYTPKNSPNNLHKRDTDVIGKHFNEVVDKNYISRFNNLYNYFKKNRDTQTFEYNIESKSGIKFWFSANVSIRLNEQDEFDGITIIARDITLKKSFEIALKEENERVESILKGTNAGTWQWDIKTGITEVNERWAEIIGYNLQELTPFSIKKWENLIHPDDLEHSDKLMNKHFSGESDYYDAELRIRHKNGHWVWTQDRGKVSSRDIHGNPLTMHGTHVDISDRKYVELAMRELANTFASLKGIDLFNSICKYTADTLGFNRAFIGQLDEINQSIQMLNYYYNKEFISPKSYLVKGSPSEIILSGKSCFFSHNIIEEFPDDEDLRQVGANGYAGVPLIDSSGNNIGIFVLISEQKNPYPQITESILSVFKTHLANELVRLKSEKQLTLLLETTNRQNSRLRSFSFITSHNIRSSVSNILGLTDVIMSDIGEPDIMIPMLNKAAKNLDSSIKNANELLNIEEKINVQEKTECNLHESINRVIFSIKQLVQKKDAQIKIDIAEDYMILAHEAYIESIFYNLISNAVKYGVNETHKDIIVSATQTPEGHVITVKDFGDGIWQKDGTNRIFDLGTRLHHSDDGQGFGLFMTKQQVEVMGGLIEVISSKGQGAIFKVHLP